MQGCVGPALDPRKYVKQLAIRHRLQRQTDSMGTHMDGPMIMAASGGPLYVVSGLWAVDRSLSPSDCLKSPVRRISTIVDRAAHPSCF